MEIGALSIAPSSLDIIVATELNQQYGLHRQCETESLRSTDALGRGQRMTRFLGRAWH